jgi:hypothetical protein
MVVDSHSQGSNISNHQVRMMGDVYSHATQVRSWLGYDKGDLPEVSTAFKLLRRSRLGYEEWDLPHVATGFGFLRRLRVDYEEWFYPPPAKLYGFLPRVGVGYRANRLLYRVLHKPYSRKSESMALDRLSYMT